MRRSYVPCVCLLIAGLAGPAQGQVTLEWKLKKDDTFYIETTSTCEQHLDILGRQAKQNVDRTTVLSFKVLEKSGDKTVLEARIDQVGVYPRGENVPNPLGNQLRNVPFKVTLDPALRVTQFDGYQDLLKKLTENDPDPQHQAEERKKFESLLSEQSLQQAVAEHFAFLPGKPVKQGDTWTKESTVSVGPLGSAKRTTTYKYEGTEMQGGKNVDKITSTAKVEFTGGGASVAGLPFQVVKAELKADDVKGILAFDSGTGRLVKSETRMTLAGPLTVDLGGTKYDATMKLDYTIKSQLSEARPASATTPAPAAGGQRGP